MRGRTGIQVEPGDETMDERHEHVAQESTDAEVDNITSLRERASERLLVLVRFVAGTYRAVA